MREGEEMRVAEMRVFLRVLGILPAVMFCFFCGAFPLYAQKAKPKDVVIKLGEEMEAINYPLGGRYALLDGEKGLYAYDRQSRAVKKQPMDEIEFLNGCFLGDMLYFVAKDKADQSEAMKTARFYKLEMDKGRPKAIAISKETQEAYARKRWALDHRGKMEGFEAGKAERIEQKLAFFVPFRSKIYAGVRDTGVFEFDPATGKSRIFFILASPEMDAGGSGLDFSIPPPPPQPLPLGDKLFFFSPVGPVFLDPDTGGWAIMAPKDTLEDPEKGAKIDTTGASIYPLDMDYETYLPCVLAQFYDSYGRLLENGTVFFDYGCFLGKGALNQSKPWAGWTGEFKEGDVLDGVCTCKNEVWLTKRGECKTENRLNLLSTNDMGATWKCSILTDISGEGMTCSPVDVNADSVVLLVRDRSKPAENYLLIRPRASLDMKPLPATPCAGEARMPIDDEEEDPPWKTLRLWKEIPDPNKPGPGPNKSPLESPFNYWRNTREGDFAIYTVYVDGAPQEENQEVLSVSPTMVNTRLYQGGRAPEIHINIPLKGNIPNPSELKGHETLKIAEKQIKCDIFIRPQSNDGPEVKKWMSAEVPLGIVKIEMDGQIEKILTSFGNKAAVGKAKPD